MPGVKEPGGVRSQDRSAEWFDVAATNCQVKRLPFPVEIIFSLYVERLYRDGSMHRE
jgi:hypothetical protein